jgi:hypothetical protein
MLLNANALKYKQCVKMKIGIKTIILLATLLFADSMIFSTISVHTTSLSLFEYYNSGDDLNAGVYGNWQAGQTFTVGASPHQVTLLKLKLYRIGTVFSVTISIKATSGGVAVGADLTSLTIDGATLPTSPSGVWVEFSISYPLSAGTMYAIVLKAPSATGAGTSLVEWRIDSTSSTYLGGTRVWSNDGGATWNIDSGMDCMFEVWGVSNYPFVSISPLSATMELGQSKQFTSSVGGGTSPFSYQWYLNGVASSGATGSSWTFTPYSAGSYTVYVNVVDSLGATAKSNTASITVNNAFSVSITPFSASLTVGGSQSFTSAILGGTSPFSYQWYLNGLAVSGASQTSYSFTSMQSGYYTLYCDATDGAGVTAKSNTALITVTVLGGLGVSIGSNATTIDLGQHVSFTSSVSGGTSPYSYQWYVNDFAVSGATSSSWTWTPNSVSDYQIYLSVTDNTGKHSVSNTAYLFVSPSPNLNPLNVAWWFIIVIILFGVVVAVIYGLYRHSKQSKQR